MFNCFVLLFVLVAWFALLSAGAPLGLSEVADVVEASLRELIFTGHNEVSAKVYTFSFADRMSGIRADPRRSQAIESSLFFNFGTRGKYGYSLSDIKTACPGLREQCISWKVRLTLRTYSGRRFSS